MTALHATQQNLGFVVNRVSSWDIDWNQAAGWSCLLRSEQLGPPETTPGMHMDPAHAAHAGRNTRVSGQPAQQTSPTSAIKPPPLPPLSTFINRRPNAHLDRIRLHSLTGPVLPLVAVHREPCPEHSSTPDS
jgi:hypothetical protein